MANPDNDLPENGFDSPVNSTLPESQPDDYNFTPEVLDKTAIAIPLLRELKKEKEQRAAIEKQIKEPEQGKETPTLPPLLLYEVIIDLNLRYTGGKAKAGKKREEAGKKVRQLIADLKKNRPERKASQINEATSQYSQQYLFARLHGDIIEEIVRLDVKQAGKDFSKRAIYRIWPDFDVKAFITKSISTVKADAAHASFSAWGKEITWAVMDSGIDRNHRHFKKHENIHPDMTYHQDFTGKTNDPFKDDFGHGTHVAGIIAGQVSSTKANISVITRQRDEQGNISYNSQAVKEISGMAPSCRLVSLKVLDDRGSGKASSLIAAIAAIQDINGYGRDIKIHGVNMSLGYDFQPEWFACGQSPLCVEVDRLVKSGVVVVAAAGNTGYGIAKSAFRGEVATGMPLSINDPGNADLAITVGSTHRDMPHTYGVSYFSSKGPTGDGRIKPDLVAPGEKIISCAAGNKQANAQRQSGQPCEYVEDSGTSMAAPHVSGVIASFLSVRREFIGKPEAVKEIFTSTATDLKRDRYFQGHGLIDLMRAIQSV